MIKDELYQEYLARAQEAEEKANLAANPDEIRAWRKVADGYLMLANMHLPQ